MIPVMVLIVLIVAWLIFQPLLFPPRGKGARGLEDAAAAGENGDAGSRTARLKESSYAAIHELTFDYRMGKLSEEDYRELYRSYKQDALQAIRALAEGEGPLPAPLDRRLEAEIGLLRGGAGGRVCPACACVNPRSARFCAGCGGCLEAFCPDCGEPYDRADRFCRGCGCLLAGGKGGEA